MAVSKRKREDVPKYKKGNIMRVRMKNFMTYDDVEFFPSPHFNFVCAPNGTGKSTMVCGLCLGLGGDPSILGRQDKPQLFIKHGRDEAFVEIEICNGDEDPIIARRTIQQVDKNHTTWQLNGRSCSQAEVRKVMKSLDIQLDNLCQFLPQDKVQNFVKLSPEKLLQETEKAAVQFTANNVSLYDLQHELHEMGKQMEDQNRTKKVKQDELERLKQQNTQLQRQVDLWKQRTEILKKVGLMKKKLPLVRLWAAEDNLATFQESISGDREKQEKLKAELATKQQPIKALKKEATELEHMSKSHGTQLAKLSNTISKKAEGGDNAMVLLSQTVKDVERIEKSKKERLARKKNFEDQLAEAQPKLEEWRGEHGDGSALKAEVSALMHRMDEFQGEIQKIQNKQVQFKNQYMSGLEGEERTIMEDIKELRNERLRRLSALDRDTQTLYRWVEQQKQAGNLQSDDVMGPILCEINVRDAEDARIVEKAIPRGTLRAFVCKAGEIQAMLLEKSQELRIKVNTLSFPRADQPFEPPVPVRDIQPLGAKGYLIDIIDAPELIKRTLCANAYIHTTVVGGAQLDDTWYSLIEKFYDRNIRKILSPTTSYMAYKSTYGNRAINASTDAIGDPRLFQPMDPNRCGDLERELKEVQRKIKEVANKEKHMQKEAEKIMVQINSLAEEKKLVVAKIREGGELMQRVKQLESRIKAIPPLNALENQIREKKAAALKAMIAFAKSTSQMRAWIAERIELSKKVDECDLQRLEKVAKAAVLERSFNHLIAEVNEIEKAIKSADQQERVLKQAVKNCKAAVTKNPVLEAEKPLLEEFPDDEGELNAMIEETQNMANGIIADESAVREFEARCQRIEELETALSNFSAEGKQLRDQLDAKREAWEVPLRDLVSRVSTIFSQYMQLLDCMGEADLKEEGDAFLDWGIEIRVKFRTEAKLEPLSPHRHSGGEKSVATMLFVAALQSLAQGPFRVVDEINQGMDARFERKVMELLIRNAHSGDTPQYFMLTPKLLNNLDLNSENVRLIFVMNGPFWGMGQNWSLQDFLQQARAA